MELAAPRHKEGAPVADMAHGSQVCKSKQSQKVSILPECRMDLVFTCSSVASVIVKCQRLSGYVRWTIKWLRVAVEGRVTGVEDDTPIEHWDDLFHALIHRRIPQLEVSTVCLVPILVEKQQQIYATIQL
jgi:hypothetical protein